MTQTLPQGNTLTARRSQRVYRCTTCPGRGTHTCTRLFFKKKVNFKKINCFLFQFLADFTARCKWGLQGASPQSAACRPHITRELNLFPRPLLILLVLAPNYIPYHLLISATAVN